MVTRNILGTCEGKLIFSEYISNLRLLSRSLIQIKLPILLHTRTHISELPSYIYSNGVPILDELELYSIFGSALLLSDRLSRNFVLHLKFVLNITHFRIDRIFIILLIFIFELEVPDLLRI